MFGYSCQGEFSPDGPTESSVGPGTAPYRLLRKADLPEIWQPIPIKNIGIELPDTPWGRSYFAWATRELRLRENSSAARGAGSEDAPGVMLVSMANFREPGDARAAAILCLQTLLSEGRPPRDHVLQILQQG
jgi:hypothetical protein